jgi:type VI secretion system secreted protein VgrG
MLTRPARRDSLARRPLPVVEISDSPASIGVVEYELSIRPRGGATIDDEDVRVRAVEIVERLGEPYRIDLSIVSTADLDVDGLLGADLVLTMRRDETERHFCGVVLQAQWRTVDSDEVHIRLDVGPALSLLGRVFRSRVFQGLTVAEILQALFDEHLGALGRELDVSRLARPPHPRDYCVQFRETDLKFARRILAEEGITFLFTHGPDVETMVLTDGTEAFRGVDATPVDGGAGTTPPLVPVILDRGELADEESIHAFGWSRRMRPGTVRVAAWDWKSTHPVRWQGEHGASDRPVQFGESYQHGDERVTEGADGKSPHDDRTATRASDEAAALERWSGQARGAGNVMSFAAGHTFELDGHGHEDFDRTWALDEVRHRGDCPQASRGASSASAGAQYENSFTAVPLSEPYAPRRLDKPRVHGHQIATVVGPAGEEIHTDALGRIKVWFHWDRDNEGVDPETSCWLRVAQMWAGAGWGSMFIPRVGMQVVVSFVDGDPDRPLCVGCVYDGAHDPPWRLPEDRTKSGIKTRSSPGGGGSNEFRFEDAAGSEQVYLHAERNLDEVVGSAHSTAVGSDQSLKVGRDQSIAIDNNRDIVIKGNQTIKVDGAPKVPGSFLGHALTVTGDIKVDATKTYTLSAPVAINLVCGKTTISMTPAGITLTSGAGAMITLDAGMLAAAAHMATQIALGASGTATLASKTGSSLDVGSDIVAKSEGGAEMAMSGDVSVSASGGGKLVLATNALLVGATTECVGSGAKLKLSGNAEVTGITASLQGASGTVVADAAGVTLKGARIGIAGAAIASIIAPLVKVN